MKNAVVIGASHAGSQLVTQLYKEGWKGKIILIGEEPQLPYHRPPLSKAFLAGEKNFDEILIRAQSVYEKIGAQLILGQKAEAIDPDNKKIILGNGNKIRYDKLALTTGARVRKIGIPGSDLKNIHYLRKIADVESIKAELPSSAKAVIVGGGYIGLETAAVLKKMGLDVTVLEMRDRVMKRVTTPDISAFYLRVHTEEGVKIELNAQVTGFEGNDKVEKVTCGNGKTYEADLVIIGIGVIPNTGLAESAGLKINNGIVVDEYAQTSNPEIVSAGDCTYHPNSLLCCNLRLESVQNASDQATTAAATICGLDKPYRAHPWFWSDQYDVNLQIAGWNNGYDQVLFRGNNKSDRKFIAWYLKKGRLIAADCVNSKKEFMITRHLLKKELSPTPDQLVDEKFDLKSLLK